MLKQIIQNHLPKQIRLNLYSSKSTVAATTKKHKKPKRDEKPPLIKCKRNEFNLLVPEKVASKFGTIPLASKGWLHYKSKGDHFTIHPTVSVEDLQAEMLDVSEFVEKSKIKFMPDLIEALDSFVEVERLTSIQVHSIPKVYDSNHVLIAAETGCGKTLAYLLPIMQRLLERKRNPNSSVHARKMNTPLAVIVTPGRELATQICTVAELLGRNTELKVKLVLGGHTKQLMLNPEFEDIDILVASMGALSKLVTTGIYRIHEVRHVVLDEADTLLDDSFTDKLVHFLKKFPFHNNHLQNDETVGTQLVLASATMPVNVEDELKRVIDIETLHQVVSPNLHKLMPHVEQRFLRMAKADRPVNLLSTVKAEVAKQRPVIVFSNKSATSDYVSIFLNNCGVNCINLNGDMLMKIRVGRFEQFQSGKCDVLSTTDVGSRGLDTKHARHIINFDFPLHISDYIHRCGRVGRIGNLQRALITNFISSRREIDIVQRIEHTARTGGLLPDVNANIKNLINQRIVKDMQVAGINIPQSTEEEQEQEEQRRQEEEIF